LLKKPPSLIKHIITYLPMLPMLPNVTVNNLPIPSLDTVKYSRTHLRRSPRDQLKIAFYAGNRIMWEQNFFLHVLHIKHVPIMFFFTLLSELLHLYCILFYIIYFKKSSFFLCFIFLMFFEYRKFSILLR
jgi:hypothetical protein